MVFTTNSDFYVAIQDAGINRLVKHVMRKRPSLFNYGTPLVALNPQLLCQQVEVAPEVLQAGNPLVTELSPLPVIQTSYALNYAVQLTKGELDFHPSNVFALSPELNPPLANQHLGVHFQVCAGVGCPPETSFPNPFPGRKTAKPTLSAISYARRGSASGVSIPTVGGISQGGDITVLPTQELDCFCLDLYATGGAKITGSFGNQQILPFVDGIDIVDLKPDAYRKHN